MKHNSELTATACTIPRLMNKKMIGMKIFFLLVTFKISRKCEVHQGR